MKAFYNEIEPYCCAWLQNLMDKGLITPGMICDTPIQNLTPEDVRGYDRCHFFTGIAGWELALQLAGWPLERPVWTGSAPCQPFSVAGKGKAQSDERHLWPHWFKLIAAVRPPVLFGEQVAGAIAHGWWDDAADDLEREGYETGACVLPACSVGAPHKRSRLWFVADSSGQRRQQIAGSAFGNEGTNERWEKDSDNFSSGNDESDRTRVMAHSEREGEGRRGISRPAENIEEMGGRASDKPIRTSDIMANTDDARPQRHGGLQECSCEQSAWASGGTVHPGWQSDTGICRISSRVFDRTLELRTGQKVVETPSRTGMLKAYGNSIVPQVAAEFIRAYMDCLS